jgi:hypothetical protein
MLARAQVMCGCTLSDLNFDPGVRCAMAARLSAAGNFLLL